MLLTDPEVESSLLISSDEGATFQKYRLNFYILSLLFHPEQEDWILAYSHDQKVRKQARLVQSRENAGENAVMPHQRKEYFIFLFYKLIVA